MALPTWLRGAAPGYGSRFAGKGGLVTIKSTPAGGSKPVSKRVPLAPAFDPLALSMVPVPGWSAAAAAAGPVLVLASGSGWAAWAPLGKAA